MDVYTNARAYGHTDAVNTLSLSKDFLASGSDDGNVYLWSLEQCSYPVFQTPYFGPCSAIKFHPDNCNILYSAHGQCIYTCDTRFLQSPIAEWKVNDDEVNSIDILECESRMAVADDTGTIQILDTYSGAVIRSLKKHDNICTVAKFRPRRSWQLISGGLDCRMIVSDWRGTGLGVIIFELNELFGNGDVDSSASQEAYDSEASTDDYSDSDVSLAEPGRLGTENDRPTVPYPNESDSISPRANASSSTSGESRDNAGRLHDESAHVRVRSAISYGIPINPPMVHCIDCSPSGDLVAAGLERSTVELFSGVGKRLTHADSLCGHRRGVSALRFVGEDHLLSGGNDCSLFIWTCGFQLGVQSVCHDAKINAIEGSEMHSIFIADHSPTVRMLDLSRL